MKEVRVFASATVANVAAGFDILGFAVDAPGDFVTARLVKSTGVRIKRVTGCGNLPKDPKKNTAGVSVLAMLEKLKTKQGIELELEKNMPIGSGLGSSSASAVAGVFAANELLGNPLRREELLPFCMEAERVACGAAHADNVGPCLMGGFVLIRSYTPLDIVSIAAPEELYCTVVHPDIEIKTADARNILKKQILFRDAIAQWGNTGGLIAGLLKSDYELIGRSLHDVIVEPVRSVLIPGFDSVKAGALKAGALGCSISGSGPSMFALSSSLDVANRIGGQMVDAFKASGLDAEVYVSKINKQGPRIIA